MIESPDALATSSLALCGTCRKTLTSFLNFLRRSCKVIWIGETFIGSWVEASGFDYCSLSSFYSLLSIRWLSVLKYTSRRGLCVHLHFGSPPYEFKRNIVLYLEYFPLVILMFLVNNQGGLKKHLCISFTEFSDTKLDFRNLFLRRIFFDLPLVNEIRPSKYL